MASSSQSNRHPIALLGFIGLGLLGVSLYLLLTMNNFDPSNLVSGTCSSITIIQDTENLKTEYEGDDDNSDELYYRVRQVKIATTFTPEAWVFDAATRPPVDTTPRKLKRSEEFREKIERGWGVVLGQPSKDSQAAATQINEAKVKIWINKYTPINICFAFSEVDNGWFVTKEMYEEITERPQWRMAKGIVCGCISFLFVGMYVEIVRNKRKSN